MMQGERRGRIGDGSTNPYHESRKYSEPTICPRCGLVYRGGRWQAIDPPSSSEQASHESHCPACRREVDRLPAGLLFLRGTYLSAHRKEILNIARNQATAAAEQRPLQRIMWIDESGDTTEIATTTNHLALRIAKAIEGACKGSLTIKHAPDAHLVRAYWEREA